MMYLSEEQETTKYLEAMAMISFTGGPGNDQFSCGAGTDTITDFQPGLDTKTTDCE